jgi:hypothetical protein
MTLMIDTTDRLDNYPAGTTIMLTTNEGGTDVYVKDEDGQWTSEGKPTIRSVAFRTAINQGRVGVEHAHQVGDWLHNPNNGHYYRVLSARHGEYRFADVEAAIFVGVVDQAVGQARDAAMPRDWQRAADEGKRLLTASLAQQRLDQILDSGEIPTEAERTVKVKVTGFRDVSPDEAQARSLLGDEAEILASGQVRIEWAKDFDITKTTRWDCACEEVTQDDIDKLSVPGTVGSWEVLTCE